MVFDFAPFLLPVLLDFLVMFMDVVFVLFVVSYALLVVSMGRSFRRFRCFIGCIYSRSFVLLLIAYALKHLIWFG